MTIEGERIRREFRKRREIIIGTVISQRVVRSMGPSGQGPCDVVDVDIGSNRIMRNVIVKGGSDGGRFYADLGQTVQIRKSTFGRWEAIAPGDRVVGQLQIKFYDPNAGSTASTGSAAQGFSVVTRPFEYLLGASAVTGAPALTFSAGGGTITRAPNGLGGVAGSFIDDGFEAGDTVRVQAASRSFRASPNAGTYVIAGGGVSALVLTFTAPGFTDEGPRFDMGVAVDLSSRWHDGTGIVPLQTVDIVDANGNIVQGGQ